jgi:ABC-type nitrate/sulfonate/bicarbonate transport system substrate-binding protein
MTIHLEYGVPTDRSGVNVRFAVHKGWFAAEGINLAIRVVFGGPEISAAYDAGALKIGELGTPPGITAIANGHRFRIIGSGLQRGVGLFFLVPPGIARWEELKGRTLGALSRGSCSYWYLRDLLAQHGIDPDRDVTIRGLGADYARQLELFAEGKIAGLLSAEPNGALGEHLGVVRSWGDVLSLADVPPLQWVIQVANDDFRRREAELVRTVQGVTQRASGYLGSHRDEWIDFTAAHFGIPRAVAEVAVLREAPFAAFDGRLDEQGLDNAIALQHRLGAVAELLPVGRFLATDLAAVAQAAE